MPSADFDIGFDVRDWVGREMVLHDEISLSHVKKIAATFNIDPDSYEQGSIVPSYWYSMFFTNNPMQRSLGQDGHPSKGEFLPPVALPKRMFVGRDVLYKKELVVGDSGKKISKIANVERKYGGSGKLVFVTVNNQIAVGDEVKIIENQHVVYREESSRLGKSTNKNENMFNFNAVDKCAKFLIDPVLLYRYSALTWNAHRIHYDNNYAVNEEGYPGCVMNGALTVHLLLDYCLDSYQAPKNLNAKLYKPLFVGDNITLASLNKKDSKIAWALNERDEVACKIEVEI